MPPRHNQACLVVFDANEPYIIRSLNTRTADTFGSTSTELLGHSILSLIAPQTDVAIRQQTKAALRAHAEGEWDLCFGRKDGSSFWACMSLTALTDASGQTHQFAALFTNIRQEKPAHDPEAIDDEALMQFANEAAEVAIGVWDFKNNRNRLDALAASWFEVPPEQAKSYPLAPLLQKIHPEDLPRVQEIMARAIESDTRYQFETRLLNSKGEIRWLYVRGRTLNNANEQPYRVIGAMVDITQRKLTELALQAREEQLRTVSNQIPHGAIFRYQRLPTGNRRFQLFSKGVAALLGVPASDALADADTIFTRLHPEDIAKSDAAELESLQNLTLLDCQLRFVIPDGQTRWVHVRSSPQQQTDGSVIWDGVVVDITHEKNVELALRESETLLNETGRIAKVGGWVYEVKENLLRWTDQVYHIHELPLEQAISLDQAIEFYHPEEQSSLRDALARAQREASSFQNDYRLRSATGKTLWVRLICHPIQQEQNVVRLWGTLQDITEQKHADLALQESEEQFRNLAEYTPAVVSRYNEEHRLCFVNRLFERTTGISTEQAIGKTLFELPGPADHMALWQNAISQVLASNQSMGLEFDFKTLEGVRSFESRLAPEHDSTGRTIGVIAITFDRTEQKQAARALSESEERYRTLVEEMEDGIYLMNTVGQIQHMNAAGCKMLGYTLEELLSTPLESLVHPNEIQRIASTIETARTQGRLSSEWRVRRRDGTIFCAEANARALSDGRMFGVLRDVTARREAQERLRASEELFRNAFEYSGIGMGLFDLEGHCIKANAVLCEIWGYSEQELQNMAVSRITHPDYLESDKRWCRSLLAGEKQRISVENRYIHRTGAEIWAHIVVSLIRDAANEPAYLLAQVRDITARKKAEAEVVFSHLILENAGDSIMVVEAPKPGKETVAPPNIVYVNKSFEAMTGWSREELLGRPCSVLEGPDNDPESAKKLWNAIHRKQPIRLEMTANRKDGTAYWLEVSVKPIATDGKAISHFVSVERDITERVRFQAKLQETQKIESLGILAGGVAHDFNNLLTTICGYATLSAEEVPPESEAQEYLNVIHNSARRAGELCQQLLAYAGRGKVIVGPVDLSQLVQETVGLLRLSISKDAHLEMQLPKSLPAIQADANQIRQVVMNLVMNASDALECKEGSITLRTGIAECSRAELDRCTWGDELPVGRYVLLEVADTGCGMDETTKSRLFDPFFTTKATGRGLGMAAVLGILKAHKGAIMVSSERGRGTQFRLLFPPLVQAQKTPAVQKDKKPRWEGTFLVADDEKPVRDMVVRMLRSFGVQTVEASNGHEAVEHVRNLASSLRIVFLDMTMPKLSGNEAYPALRKLQPTLPVVIMSGFAAAEVITGLDDNQQVTFLQKPFSKADLVKAIESLLGPAAPT